MRVGFVGLGAMGLAMATNLLKAGHQVTGFDLEPRAIAALAAAGGTAAKEARDTVEGTNALLLMVVSGYQAEQVLFGEEDLAAAMSPETVVVASCTQSPVQAANLAGRLGERGLAMLDAPVSGGTAGAKAASLTFMCGGPRAVFEEISPMLLAMGRNLYHVGEAHGAGSTAKLINQLLCGVHLAAAAEAMNLAERAGVSLQVIHDIISVSAGNSWIWGDRGPRMLLDDPPVTSAVDIFVKDLGIVLEQGRAARQALPMAAAAHQMFLAASGLGHGREDDSQIIAAYRALNGGAASNDET